MAKDKTPPAGTSPTVPDVPPHPLLPDDHPEKQRVTEFHAQRKRAMDAIMQWWDPAEDAVPRENKRRGGKSGDARMKSASDEDALEEAKRRWGLGQSTNRIAVALAEKFSMRQEGAWKSFIKRAEAKGDLPKRLR